MSIRVLHVTNAYPYEGTPEYGIFVKEQIESLRESGVTNVVYFINARERGLIEYIRSIRDLRNLRRDFDLIHCHHVYSFYTAIFAFGLRYRFVLSLLNGWENEVKGRWLNYLSRIICGFPFLFVDKVIFKCPVPNILMGFKKFINLPNGVDFDFFSPKETVSAKAKLGIKLDSKYLLFVSSKNLNRSQKRYDIFCNVLKYVKEKLPHMSIEELRLTGVDRYLVPYYMNSSAIHVLTSDYEGSPNSVKEALACGTPVVTRAVGNIEQMCGGLYGVKIVNNDCYKEIGRAVIHFLNSSIDKDDVRQSFYLKGLDIHNVAINLKKLYESLPR